MGGALKKSSKLQSSGAPGPGRSGRIRDPRAIAALAQPARQELIDTVEALGGAATIAELAAQLGRPADGLYYHVRRLVAAGLLVPAPANGGGERFRVPTSRSRALDYAPDDPKNAAAVRRVVAGMLRIARKDFDRGLAIPDVVTHGAHRALWASRAKAWVGPAELAEINALLARLVALLRRPRARGRDRLISLCWVLAPTPPHAGRRRQLRGSPVPKRRS